MSKTIRVERIMTLDDVVERDGKPNVKAWLLDKCNESLKAGKIHSIWDGETVEGEPVKAFVNNGRWGARCKVCSNPMYVSPRTPVFYCTECGNGGASAAWGVEFPANLDQIEAALLKREVVVDESRLIRNIVELAFQSRPAVAGLARNWRPGVSVEQLESETADKKEMRRR